MINTDDDLLELLLIPKVGRAKAKILYAAGFRTCEDIAKAGPEELAKLPGIGQELARSIADYAFHATMAAPRESAGAGSELLICPNCGSMVSGSTNVCSGCGITFSDEVEDIAEPAVPAEAGKGEADGHWYKEQGKLFICPNCGSLVSDKSDSCPKCGILFAGEEEEGGAPAAPEAPKGDADGYWYRKDDSGLFMCPNCGAFIARDATGCSICGMAFEPDDGEEESGPPTPEAPAACPMCKAQLPEGADICKSCGYDLALDKDIDGHRYRDRAEIFLCPDCGAFISKSADACPKCGLVLEGEEDDGDATRPAPRETKCPMCGAALAAGKGTCEGCGFDFTADRGDGFWYREERSALFICPACGAFISETAESCTNCGATFDENGEAVPPARPEKAADAGVDELTDLVLGGGAPADGGAAADIRPAEADGSPDQLAVCPVCGAFIQANLLKCPVCAAVFDDIGEMELETAAVQPAETVEELNRQISDDVREIEEMLVVRPEPPAEKRGGVSKDFLDRWKKLDSGRPAAPAPAAKEQPGEDDATLELELERMLVSEAGEPSMGIDPAEEARALAAAGDADAALAVLEAAAEADHSRATEYKRLMLEVMGGLAAGADISDALAEDELGELVLDVELARNADLQRLGEIDAALAGDGDDGTLWQEKGDILERLGRHREAVECFDRSIALSYADLRRDSKPAAIGRGPRPGQGLTNGRVNGLTNGGLAGAGRTNGKVNGLTNGRVNGRTNGRGRVNGLVNGMTNGRVNGRTNGRTNGRGRVNGLVNGLTNGRTNGRTNGFGDGRVNGLINGGLVNGLGLVNGEGMVDGSGALLRLRHRRRERIMWRYKLTAMVMFVTLVLMISMLGNLAVRQEGGAFAIDGGFADWEDVRGYSNSVDEEVMPSLRILETRMAVEDTGLYVYTVFGDQGFVGTGAPGNVDSLWIAVDADPAADTGYLMGGMGVDLMGEVYGWNGSVMGSQLLRFGGADRDDWAGFSGAGALQASLDGERLEARISMPRDIASRALDPHVRVITVDSEGNSDLTRYLMGAKSAGMTATFECPLTDIIQPGAEAVELGKVTLASHSDGTAGFTSLDFAITGGASQADVLDPFLLSDGLPAQAHASYPGPGTLRFEFQQPFVPGLGTTVELAVAADIPLSAEGKTLGLMLVNATADSGEPEVGNTGTRLHSVGAPSSMAVDGAFGDWPAAPAYADALGDVYSGNTGSAFINSNVDLESAGFAAPADGSGSLYFRLAVAGTMMGGSSIPTIRHRPSAAPAQYRDSDRDTVPDNQDPYMQDFNNDGTPDAQSVTGADQQDADGDGSADYPAGPDRWLNTTLPPDFPEPYAGRFVSVYIGPIDAARLENRGEDWAYLLFDADNDTGTGMNLKGGLGIDSLVAVSGKGNRVLSAALYSIDPASETGWSFAANVSAATDWDRMEGAVPLDCLLQGGQLNMTAYVQLEDWRGARDQLDSPAALEVPAGAVPGTRAAKPNLDITKTVNLATAAPGDLLTYTITILNQRGAAAYNVRVTETYPAGVTFVSATPAPSVGNNVWNLGTMSVGSTRTITVTVQIASTGFVGGEVLTNTASVYFTDGGAWSKTKTDTASTTIVVPVPEMGAIILPVCGLMLIGTIVIGKRRAENE